ncbi:MAG: electron transport complex subunit RsxC [bacterium]|nr:electron transport complex subunit RsxC [bacterium]
MSLADAVASTRSTFRRGIHPPDEKALAAESPIEVLPTPKEIRVPLLQHLGSPCEPTVKPKQAVALGDEVGNVEAMVSAPVHASVAGTVGRATVATLPNGRHVGVLPIKAGEQEIEGRDLYQDLLGGEWPLEEIERCEPREIVEAVRRAGLIGMGGAAFPTHVKLTARDDKPIDTVLVNGCECEPYLAADYRTMIEAPAAIVAGALLAKRALGARRLVVGIEDNKPKAIQHMKTAASGTAVEVKSVRTKYPQGAEKQLVRAVLAATVPEGGLPLDVGALVVNVETAASIARAVLRGKPLTHRIVTVSGRGVARPRNLVVPIGISFSELLAASGGVLPGAARILAGGPMMGFCVGSTSAPVTKGTGAVTVLTHADLQRARETACVRCGRCVDVCPLSLVPTRIAIAARHKDWDLARRYHIKTCMECGCCAWVCPAQIPLVQLIRMGKAEMATA